MLTLALWGRSVEIMVNQFTNFDANLVKISATLLGDVAAGCWPLSQLVIRSRYRWHLNFVQSLATILLLNLACWAPGA